MWRVCRGVSPGGGTVSVDTVFSGAEALKYPAGKIKQPGNCYIYGKSFPRGCPAETYTEKKMKNRYLIRSLKYLVQLLVLLAVLFVAMALTRTSRVAPGELFEAVFMTRRGVMLLAAIVLLAAFYPRFGFVHRTVAGIDWACDRAKIVELFALCGYEPVSEEPDRVVFRASTPLRKLTSMGEDAIVLTPGEGEIVFEGLRKEVVRIEFRIRSYMNNR